MKSHKPLSVVFVLVCLGVALGLTAYYLFLGTSINRESAPIVAGGQPPGNFEASYEYLSFENLVNNSDVIFAGQVISISRTFWNQDSGEYWEQKITKDDLETVVTALPYYDTKIRIINTFINSADTNDAEMIVTALGMSPADGGQLKDSSNYFKTGDEIIVFARFGDIGWNSDGARHLSENGHMKLGRKTVLLFSGDPDQSFMKKNSSQSYSYFDSYQQIEYTFTDDGFSDTVINLRTGGN